MTYTIEDFRVAIYCRLSKSDGDDSESNSIKTQRLMIESYCRRYNWTIYDAYIDDGFSGTNFERPAFKKMYQDILDAKINIVITKDLSRLGRNYILIGYYYQIFFPQARVRYIAINDHIDTQYENNDISISAFKNILNDYHSKSLSKFLPRRLVYILFTQLFPHCLFYLLIIADNILQHGVI